MQTPKNLQKQNCITSPGNNTSIPVVPITLEQEILLKKIESLNYSIREQKTKNARLTCALQKANNFIKSQDDEIDLQDVIIQQFQANAKTHEKLYTELVNSFLRMNGMCMQYAKIIKSLTKGQEWKPPVKEIIEALKLPLHLN